MSSTTELEREVSDLREKLSDALAGGMAHKSDCAVCSAPAEEPGPCNCGVGTSADKYKRLLIRVATQFRHRGCECMDASDTCCGYAEAKVDLGDEL